MELKKLSGPQKLWLYNHGERRHGGLGRHWGAKDGANIAASVTGLGASGAQSLTGATTGAALGLSASKPLWGAAAISATSATGVGLVVGAAALSLLMAGLSARSAFKTHRHIQGLHEIQRHAWQFRNTCVPRVTGPELVLSGMKVMSPEIDHMYLEQHVLPYIVSKKKSKRFRKGASATILYSPFESARGLLKNVYKRYKKTLGVNRSAAAELLAFHFQSCYCGLARAIIAELLTTGEMNQLQITTGGVVVEILERKIKSK